MSSESMFTPPSEFCPHPERWNAADGLATEFEVIELVAGFVRAIQPNLVVETGTHHGFTSQAIGQALQKNGHGKLITLDYDGECCKIARERCKGLPVDVLYQNSLHWIPTEQVDFGWFDSEAIYRPQEILKYYPFLKGAIIGIHDTGPQHPTRRYLEESLGPDKFRPIYLRTPRGVCFAEIV